MARIFEVHVLLRKDAFPRFLLGPARRDGTMLLFAPQRGQCREAGADDSDGVLREDPE